jgi:hypothetical protein
MEKKPNDRLQFDRRLVGRRDWVSDKVLQQKLDSLPDVSDKIAPFEEREGGEDVGSEDAG